MNDSALNNEHWDWIAFSFISIAINLAIKLEPKMTVLSFILMLVNYSPINIRY